MFQLQGILAFAKECRKPKREKDYTYYKEKMLLYKQAKKGVPLQAEQDDWLEDTNEEVDEKELKHITCTWPRSKRQHSEQPVSINNTCLVGKVDSNVIPDLSDTCKNDNQADQNAKECDDQRVMLANLIIVQLILFIVDSGCTKHTTGNLKLLCNFVEKYMGTVRDGENLDKMKEKGDSCILVGYSTHSKGYHVYNKRTRLVVESIHIRFDEIKEMTKTSVANDTSGLVPQRQKASNYGNSDPDPHLQNVSSSVVSHVPSQQELDLLFGPLYDESFAASPSTHSYVHAEENNDDQAQEEHLQDDEFTNPFCTPIQKVAESSSHNIVQIRQQLATDPEMCMFALTMSTAEPKNIKDSMDDSTWIEAMQEELHQFDRLHVWELVDKPFGKWYQSLVALDLGSARFLKKP
nr:hypothetical protein [Tanacetum cinerariifolium]